MSVMFLISLREWWTSGSPAVSWPGGALLVGAARGAEVLAQHADDPVEGRVQLVVVLRPVGMQLVEARRRAPLPRLEQGGHLAVEPSQLGLHHGHDPLHAADRGRHRLLVGPLGCAHVSGSPPGVVLGTTVPHPGSDHKAKTRTMPSHARSAAS